VVSQNTHTVSPALAFRKLTLTITMLPAYLAQNDIGRQFAAPIAPRINRPPNHWFHLAAANGGKPPLNIIFGGLGPNPHTNRPYFDEVQEIIYIVRAIQMRPPCDLSKDSQIIRSNIERYQDSMENGCIAVAVMCGLWGYRIRFPNNKQTLMGRILTFDSTVNC